MHSFFLHKLRSTNLCSLNRAALTWKTGKVRGNNFDEKVMEIQEKLFNSGENEIVSPMSLKMLT